MAKRIKMDMKTARAIGQDAGSKSARKAGRAVWSVEDWDAAAEAMDAALKLIGQAMSQMAGGMPPRETTVKEIGGRYLATA